MTVDGMIQEMTLHVRKLGNGEFQLYSSRVLTQQTVASGDPYLIVIRHFL
jgi:hypothetical protein